MRFLLITIICLLVLPVKAAEWSGPDDVLDAASKGNPEAQLEMGILYQFGFHMPGNKVPALAWYLASAEQGNQAAAQKSSVLEQEMLPAEVEEARALSQNLSALVAVSRTTTSNPDHVPMPPPGEPGQNVLPEIIEGGSDGATGSVMPETMPENSTAEKEMVQKTEQGEVTQEAAPELLPSLDPETKPDGPITPEPVK